MPIILLINLKGGVAKTTNAVALAECFASNGRNTLLIDADHQCMASELLLGEDRQLESDENGKNLHDLLSKMLKADFKQDHYSKYVIERGSNIGGGLKNLSVLPCSMRIDDFRAVEAKARRDETNRAEFRRVWINRRKQFRRWANSRFEYTFIDCPPSLQPRQMQFLLGAADTFILPTIPNRLSVRGSLYLLERLKRHQFKIAPLGTLWSMYRCAAGKQRNYVEESPNVADHVAQLPPRFVTRIPLAARIEEAAEIENHRPASFSQKYGEFARLFESLRGEIEQRVRLPLPRTEPPESQPGVPTTNIPPKPMPPSKTFECNGFPVDELVEILDRIMHPAVAGSRPYSSRLSRLNSCREALASCTNFAVPEELWKALVESDRRLATNKDGQKLKKAIQDWCSKSVLQTNAA